MRSCTLVALALGLAAGVGVLGQPQARGADKDDPVKVKFESVDQVELHGLFYPNGNGKKAPAVLLLRKVEGDTQVDEWGQLAKDLQKEGCAVLIFDWRGHGDSTSVAPGFWNDNTSPAIKSMSAFNVANYKKSINPSKPPESISIKDFNKSYYPALVNDIAAAKMFLDQKNDAGECNSSNLILIGAEDGAALGVIWVYSELFRFRYTGGLLTGPLKQAQNPEGKDVTACIWLSLSQSLGGRPLAISDWVTFIGKDKKVPMAFVYGEKDSTSTSLAQRLFDKIKPDKDAKVKLTGKQAIKGTDLKGHALLGDKLDGRSWILEKYLKVLKEEQVPPGWEEKKMEESQAVWSIPGMLRPIDAKFEKDKKVLPVPLDKLQILR
jgi:pimeloyl-ACP methyl ester carboxylesterase